MKLKLRLRAVAKTLLIIALDDYVRGFVLIRP